MADLADLLDEMRDLLKQATEEKSHYYTANVLRRAIAEIEARRSVSFTGLDIIVDKPSRAVFNLRDGKIEVRPEGDSLYVYAVGKRGERIKVLPEVSNVIRIAFDDR